MVLEKELLMMRMGNIQTLADQTRNLRVFHLNKLPEVPLVVGWGADTAEELSFSKNGAGSMSR